MGSLGFPRQREEAVCQCNAYSPNVITCDRDKEGHILPFKFISLCKVLLPFNHFQGELLPWGLLSRWMGSSEVRPSSDACWFVFSHPFSCHERREVQRRWRVVTLSHYSLILGIGLCLWSLSGCIPHPPFLNNTGTYIHVFRIEVDWSLCSECKCLALGREWQQHKWVKPGGEKVCMPLNP